MKRIMKPFYLFPRDFYVGFFEELLMTNVFCDSSCKFMNFLTMFAFFVSVFLSV